MLAGSKNKGKVTKRWQDPKKNILAKCPNTVWVLHREKVVLGVVLSCYVVLGSRVVLCCVYLKSIGNPGFGGGLGWFLEAVCSDS